MTLTREERQAAFERAIPARTEVELPTCDRPGCTSGEDPCPACIETMLDPDGRIE